MRSDFVFSAHLCMKSWATVTRGFSFSPAEGWLPLFSRPFLSSSGVCCFSTQHGDPEKNGSSVCQPACILHPLLPPASLSGLLTAGVQLSFYALLTGFSEARRFLKRGSICINNAMWGGLLETKSKFTQANLPDKPIFFFFFFLATHTSYSYHLYAKTWLRIWSILCLYFLCPVLLNKPKIYLIFWASLNRIHK